MPKLAKCSTEPQLFSLIVVELQLLSNSPTAVLALFPVPFLLKETNSSLALPKPPCGSMEERNGAILPLRTR